MFNIKEKLEQIRKNKAVKEEVSSFQTENNNPEPLFEQPKNIQEGNADVMGRLARLQNTIGELSSQLKQSNEVIRSLKKQNSGLETKILKLEYQNSQLKVGQRSAAQLKSEKAEKPQQSSNSKSIFKSFKEPQVSKALSHAISDEALFPQVEQSLQQVKKEPIENILKRMEHNFRALKTDPKQTSSGNRALREFAAVCKDYGKTLKKPVLVLKLNSSDFD